MSRYIFIISLFIFSAATAEVEQLGPQALPVYELDRQSIFYGNPNGEGEFILSVSTFSYSDQRDGSIYFAVNSYSNSGDRKNPNYISNVVNLNVNGFTYGSYKSTCISIRDRADSSILSNMIVSQFSEDNSKILFYLLSFPKKRNNLRGMDEAVADVCSQSPKSFDRLNPTHSELIAEIGIN